MPLLQRNNVPNEGGGLAVDELLFDDHDHAEGVRRNSCGGNNESSENQSAAKATNVKILEGNYHFSPQIALQ